MKKQLLIMRETYNESKFVKPDRNRGDNKPVSGGLWTSELIGEQSSHWSQWTASEGFYEEDSLIKYIVEPKPSAKVLKITSKKDYIQAIESYGTKVDDESFSLSNHNGKILDYNRMMLDYDGLQLTESGLIENRIAFYSWSCESTVWFTIDKFASVEQVS